jgi:hypothetical protein
MKKIALLLLTIVTVSSNAQNLTTFGLSGNANNLTHNPAADPLTSFHLNYMGLNNTLGMNQTAGEIFATTDLLANLSNLNSNALSLTGETSIDIFHLGFKAGKTMFSPATPKMLPLDLISIRILPTSLNMVLVMAMAT